MAYEFCKAGIEDFKEVAELYRAAVEHMVRNGILQWDEIYPNEGVLFDDILQGEMYLLREKHRLVACVVINEEQDEAYQTGTWLYPEDRVIVIHRLCVHPDAQGSGNGRRMMQYTEELIRERGFSVVRLDAFSQNEAATRLYGSLGYRHAGEVHFRKGLFYLMEKKLY